MNRNAVVIAVVVVLAAGGAFYYWQHNQAPQQTAPGQPVPKPAPPAQPAPGPQAMQHAEVPAAHPELPPLAGSDKFVLDAIAALVANPSLMKLFHTELVVHNIVATVDNLPREHAPLSVMPLKPATGAFLTAGAGDNIVIAPKNAARYAAYMQLAQVDSKKLVELYVRLYPLFQQAYEQLGYPKAYFNDRLIEALDDLLDAPDLKGPVKLVRPNVLYRYADPELEAAPAGQKIIMRIGSANAAKIKAKLREIRQELMLHTQDGKLRSASE